MISISTLFSKEFLTIKQLSLIYNFEMFSIDQDILLSKCWCCFLKVWLRWFQRLTLHCSNMFLLYTSQSLYKVPSFTLIIFFITTQTIQNISIFHNKQSNTCFEKHISQENKNFVFFFTVSERNVNIAQRVKYMRD